MASSEGRGRALAVPSRVSGCLLVQENSAGNAWQRPHNNRHALLVRLLQKGNSPFRAHWHVAMSVPGASGSTSGMWQWQYKGTSCSGSTRGRVAVAAQGGELQWQYKWASCSGNTRGRVAVAVQGGMWQYQGCSAVQGGMWQWQYEGCMAVALHGTCHQPSTVACSSATKHGYAVAATSDKRLI